MYWSWSIHYWIKVSLTKRIVKQNKRSLCVSRLRQSQPLQHCSTPFNSSISNASFGPLCTLLINLKHTDLCPVTSLNLTSRILECSTNKTTKLHLEFLLLKKRHFHVFQRISTTFQHRLYTINKFITNCVMHLSIVGKIFTLHIWFLRSLQKRQRNIHKHYVKSTAETWEEYC